MEENLIFQNALHVLIFIPLQFSKFLFIANQYQLN